MGWQDYRQRVGESGSTAGVAIVPNSISHLNGTDIGKDGDEAEGGGRIRGGSVVDVELPSFVDDMCMDIVAWKGNNNMQRTKVNGQRIVREVVEECKLPLEEDKEETLHLRKSRKK